MFLILFAFLSALAPIAEATPNRQWMVTRSFEEITASASANSECPALLTMNHSQGSVRRVLADQLQEIGHSYGDFLAFIAAAEDAFFQKDFDRVAELVQKARELMSLRGADWISPLAAKHAKGWVTDVFGAIRGLDFESHDALRAFIDAGGQLEFEAAGYSSLVVQLSRGDEREVINESHTLGTVLQWPSLKKLQLTHGGLGQSHLKLLAQAPHLQMLTLLGISFAPDVHDPFVEIAKNKHLVGLNVVTPFVSARDLNAIIHMKNLKSLSISASRPEFHSGSLGDLSQSGLVELAFSTDFHFESRDVQAIAKIPYLRSLSLPRPLHQVDISDDLAKELVGMNALVDLALPGWNLSGPGWRALGDLPALKKLWYPGGSGSGLEQILTSRTLETLQVLQIKITDAQAKALSRHPTLNYLEAQGNLGPDGVRALLNGRALRKVALYRNDGDTSYISSVQSTGVATHVLVHDFSMGLTPKNLFRAGPHSSVTHLSLSSWELNQAVSEWSSLSQFFERNEEDVRAEIADFR